jgi:autotransporter-associated beta strand protein
MLAVATLFSTALHAADVSWTNVGTTGDASDPANWDSNPNSPASGDTLYVRNGGTANFTADMTADNLYLGRGGGTIGYANVASGTLTVAGELLVADDLSTGVLAMSGGTINTAVFDIARWSGTAGTLDMTGGTINVGDWLRFGDTWDGTNGFANGMGTITGSSVVKVKNNIDVGAFEFGVGDLTLGVAGSSDAPSVASGSFNIGGYSGTVTMNAASTLATGAINVGNGVGAGSLTINDNAVVTAGKTTVGISGTGGTLSLNGGTLATTALAGTATGVGTVNFNGGTLKALAGGASFISGTGLYLNVQAGGAKIDSNGFSITSAVAMSGTAGDGGLRKLGLGRLTLTSNNAIFGGTTVEKGELIVTSSGYLANSPVTVKSGALLGGEGLTLSDVVVESGATIISGTPQVTGTYLGMNTLTLQDQSILKVKGAISTLWSTAIPVVASGAAIVDISVDDTSLLGPSTMDLVYWSTPGTISASSFVPKVDTLGAYQVTLSADTDSLNANLSALGNYMSAAGEYFTPGNWTGSVQQGVSAIGCVKAGGAITVTGPLSVGTLVLDNVGNTVSGGAITLNTTTAAAAQLATVQGSHSIANDLTLNKDMVASVNGAANVLTLSGIVASDVPTRALTISGGGTLALTNPANTFSGPIAIENSALATSYSLPNAISANGATAKIIYNGAIAQPANRLAISPLTDVTIEGNGSLDLTSADDGAYSLGNVFTANKGTLTMNRGQLMAASPMTFASNDAVVLNLGGTAVFGTYATTTSYLAKNTGTLTLNLTDSAVFKCGGPINIARENAGGTPATSPKVAINLSGSAAIISGDEIRSADANFSKCDYVMTGGSITSKQMNFAYGYGASSKLNISGGTVNCTSLYFGNKMGATIKAGEGLISGGTMNVAGSTFIGYGGTRAAFGSTTINLDYSGYAALKATGSIHIGYGSSSSETGLSSTVTMTGHSSMTAGAQFNLGTNQKNATGTLIMSGDSSITSVAQLAVGNIAGSTGTLTMTGNSTATVTDPAGMLKIGAGAGTVNLGGSASDNVVVSANSVRIGSTATSIAALNLGLGSTVKTGRVFSASTPVSSTLNFNGGLLKATASDYVNPETFVVTPYFNADNGSTAFYLNVLAGGAKIDANGFNISLPASLSLVGDAAGRGLTVSSGSGTPGTLTLTGAVSNIGPVTIGSNATLQMNNGATTFTTVSGAGSLKVVDGSTLNATSINLDALIIGGPVSAASASTAAVPEPGTFVLLALAGVGAILAVWRRK